MRARPIPKKAALRWLVLGVSLLAACASAPDAPPRPIVPQETGRLFLFSVSPIDGAARAHLFGTLHAAPPDVEMIDPRVATALAESETLVLEVAPAELEPLKAAAVLMQVGLLTDGCELRDLLPEDVYERLRLRYAGRELEWAGIQRMKPWFVLMQLIAEQFRNEGFTAEGGAERRLGALAGPRQRLGLETVAEQLVALDSLPESAQVEALEGLLELREDPDALDLDLLFAAWRAGDLAALEAIAIPDTHGNPALEAFTDAIYTRRNRIMAERIDALLRDDDRRHFVAIGAAHLVGSEGLPALLEARGWRVRQLEKSSPAAAR